MEKILTAKEWLEKEHAITKDGKLHFTFDLERIVRDYSNYKNKVLEDRINEFKIYLKTEEDRYGLNQSFAHAEISEAFFYLREEYDKHFNI